MMEICSLCKRRPAGNVDPLWEVHGERPAALPTKLCDDCWRVSMVAGALGAASRLDALRAAGAPQAAIQSAEGRATAAWNRAELAARIDRGAR